MRWQPCAAAPAAVKRSIKDRQFSCPSCILSPSRHCCCCWNRKVGQLQEDDLQCASRFHLRCPSWTTECSGQGIAQATRQRLRRDVDPSETFCSSTRAWWLSLDFHPSVRFSCCSMRSTLSCAVTDDTGSEHWYELVVDVTLRGEAEGQPKASRTQGRAKERTHACNLCAWETVAHEKKAALQPAPDRMLLHHRHCPLRMLRHLRFDASQRSAASLSSRTALLPASFWSHIRNAAWSPAEGECQAEATFGHSFSRSTAAAMRNFLRNFLP